MATKKKKDKSTPDDKFQKLVNQFHTKLQREIDKIQPTGSIASETDKHKIKRHGTTAVIQNLDMVVRQVFDIISDLYDVKVSMIPNTKAIKDYNTSIETLITDYYSILSDHKKYIDKYYNDFIKFSRTEYKQLKQVFDDATDTRDQYVSAHKKVKKSKDYKQKLVEFENDVTRAGDDFDSFDSDIKYNVNIYKSDKTILKKCENIIGKVESFIKSESGVLVPGGHGQDVRLNDIIKEGKSKKRKEFAGNAISSTAGALFGSALPFMVPKGIKSAKEGIKNFKEADLLTKLKMGGNLAIKTMGLLTGSSSMLMGSSFIEESIKADRQRKDDLQKAMKSYKKSINANVWKNSEDYQKIKHGERDNRLSQQAVSFGGVSRKLRRSSNEVTDEATLQFFAAIAKGNPEAEKHLKIMSRLSKPEFAVGGKIKATKAGGGVDALVHDGERVLTKEQDAIFVNVAKTNEGILKELHGIRADLDEQTKIAEETLELSIEDKEKAALARKKGEKSDKPTVVDKKNSPLAEKTGASLGLTDLVLSNIIGNMLSKMTIASILTTAIPIALPLIVGGGLLAGLYAAVKDTIDYNKKLKAGMVDWETDESGNMTLVAGKNDKKGLAKKQAAEKAYEEEHKKNVASGKISDTTKYDNGSVYADTGWNPFKKKFWNHGEEETPATQKTAGALASGGQFTATSATSFLAGEAGKEKVTVEPLDKIKKPQQVILIDDKSKQTKKQIDLATKNKELSLKTTDMMLDEKKKKDDDKTNGSAKADEEKGLLNSISDIFNDPSKSMAQKVGSSVGAVGSSIGNGVKSMFGGGGSKFDVSKLQSGVGAVAAQFESGGKGYGAISSGKGDAGGKSYGKHQLASNKGRVDEFLKSSGYSTQFSGLKVGSAEFDSKWTELATNDKNFGKAQDTFIAQTHAAPQLAKLEKFGIDTKNRAIQEMAFSTGVQYGPNSSVIIDAIKASGKDPKTLKVKEIINIVQDYKAGNVANNFKSSNAKVQQGVANRHNGDERKALLATADFAEGSQQNPIKAAKGFSGIVKKPTYFITGEDGEEIVNIIPKATKATPSMSMGNIDTNDLSSTSTPTPKANIASVPSAASEGTVNNIKNNSFSTSNQSTGSRMASQEAGLDTSLAASIGKGTQNAINNISVNGGSQVPTPPTPNIFTGDMMSFATRLAKSY